MTRANEGSDPYVQKLYEHWDAITGMYCAFPQHAPIIEFDVASGQIVAWPAEEYIGELTERTREQTRKQYQQAVTKGALMVFVRDAPEEILRSYVFPPAGNSVDEP